MDNKDMTPIIIGVGQITKDVPQNISDVQNHAELAAEAAQLAIDDTSAENINEAIDTIAVVRTFADSSPLLASLFGSHDFQPLMQSEDVKEGIMSFLERREAVFKGK